MGKDTFQLFRSLPSFGEGMARVLDIGGKLDDGYVIRDSPAEADARATASDWGATLDDILTAATASNGEKP